MLVEGVVRLEAVLYLIMTEQDERRARILGQDQVGLTEHTHGAVSHVLQVPHRRGDDRKLTHQTKRRSMNLRKSVAVSPSKSHWTRARSRSRDSL